MAKKWALVITDDQKLGKTLEHLLKHNGLKVEMFVENAPDQRAAYGAGDVKHTHFDLLIVAISWHDHDPLVWLKSCLTIDRVRQLPWLVISNRPFADDLDRQMAHLYFPFDIVEFWRKVEELLESGFGGVDSSLIWRRMEIR